MSKPTGVVLAWAQTSGTTFGVGCGPGTLAESAAQGHGPGFRCSIRVSRREVSWLRCCAGSFPLPGPTPDAHHVPSLATWHPCSPSLAEASHADKLGALPAQEFSACSCSVWWEMPLNLGRFRDRDKLVPDLGPPKAPGCSSNGFSSASGVSKRSEISEVENCLPLQHSEGTNTFNS